MNSNDRDTNQFRPHAKRERGAAMLIVMMVLLTTTATATFAIHSTTMEMRSAGHMRQAMQTSYLAEGGAYTALSYIDAVGAQAAFVQYSRTTVAAGTVADSSETAMTRDGNILRIEMTDFDSALGVVGPPLERDELRQPSLGQHRDYSATFRVDGQDVYRVERSAPGRDQTGRDQLNFVRVTLTSRGRLAPSSDFRAAGDSRDFHETVVNARAITEVGPFAAAF